jgi:hypothetical protein
MNTTSLGTIIYGDLTVVPGLVAGIGKGNLTVTGDVYVRGKLTVMGETKLEDGVRNENAALREEIAGLRDRVKDLERTAVALWNSPGMPGFIMAQHDFNERALISGMHPTRSNFVLILFLVIQIHQCLGSTQARPRRRWPQRGAWDRAGQIVHCRCR